MQRAVCNDFLNDRYANEIGYPPEIARVVVWDICRIYRDTLG